MLVKSHTRCPECGRLLVRQLDGKFPRHRLPPPSKFLENRKTPPLTGLDAPWCGEEDRP